MASRVTLYCLDEDKDTRYLATNGIPDAVSPSAQFAFHQWRKNPGGRFDAKPIHARLEYPDSYLSQLSAA
jgi:hypothetical protein